MNARNFTTFAVLLLVALGTWYLARSLQSAEVTENVTDGSGDGFYLKSARILGTDVEGQLLYEIEADFVEQQESNEIAMQNVKINYSDGWLAGALDDRRGRSDDQRRSEPAAAARSRDRGQQCGICGPGHRDSGATTGY